VRRFLIGALTP